MSDTTQKKSHNWCLIGAVLFVAVPCGLFTLLGTLGAALTGAEVASMTPEERAAQQADHAARKQAEIASKREAILADPPPYLPLGRGADCRKLAKTFGLQTDYTEPQLDAMLDRMQDRPFLLDQLTVEGVENTFGRYTLSLKCAGSQSFTSDFIVSLDESKVDILSIRKGSQVSLCATPSHYTRITGLSFDLVRWGDCGPAVPVADEWPARDLKNDIEVIARWTP